MVQILMVDDDPSILKFAEIFFEQEGTIQVDAVTSPSVAMDKLKSRSYDAIISDYKMHEIDGIAFLKAVRSRDLDIPFIIFTGKGYEDVAIEALNKGASYYLRKEGDPNLQFKELLHQIRHEIEHRQMKERLSQSEEMYRMIFESTGTALVIINENGNIILANDEFKKIIGYSRKEVEGKSFLREFIGEDDLTSMNESGRLQNVGAYLSESRNEIKLIDKYGNYKDVHLSVSNIPGTKESLITIIDITDGKLQQELILAQHDLALRFSTVSSFDEALEACLDSAIRVSAMDCGGIFLFDENSGLPYLICANGVSDNFLNVISRWKADSKAANQVRNANSLYLSSDNLDLEMREAHVQEGILSVAVLPIIYRDKVIGTFNLGSHTLKDPLAIRSDALEAIGAQVGNAFAAIQAEARLKESEERLKLALDGANVSFWDHDLVTGKIVRSKRFAEMLGYSPEELPSDERTRKITPHPEDITHMNKAIQDHVEGKTPYSEDEVRLKCKKGGWKWVYIRGKVVCRDETGHPIRMAGIHQDITERKGLENRIYRLNQFHQSILDNANVWLSVFDEMGNVLIFNRAAEEISGYSREEAEGNGKIWEWLYPDEEYRKEVMDRIALVLTGEVFDEIERTIRRKDGQDRIISWYSRCIKDEKGNPAGLIAMGRDITESKQAQAEARRRGKLLSAAATASHELLTFNDRDCAICRAIETFGVAIGVDHIFIFENHDDPKTGKHLMSHRHGWQSDGRSSYEKDPGFQNLSRDIISKELSEYLSAGKTVKLTNPDHSDILSEVAEESDKIISLLLVPIIIENKLWGFIGLEDRHSERILSESEVSVLSLAAKSIASAIMRRKSDEALLKANYMLEERVNERTAELNALNRELNSFVYSVSHDLRAPLRGLQGFSTFMYDEYSDVLGEAGRGYLKRIQKISADMDRQVLDLLDYSRIGRIVSLPETVDLRRLALEAYEDVDSLANDRQVKFMVKGEFPVMACERSRMKQIFTNLIGNSLKYTGEKPLIEVGCENCGEYYEFCVSDNGTGFDMEYHDRIFELFRRLALDKEGSGIGLATVKKIVESLGGKIWAESIPGEGSCFRFTIPRENIEEV
jgi:PAS domain S-box-containing protein